MNKTTKILLGVLIAEIILANTYLATITHSIPKPNNTKLEQQANIPKTNEVAEDKDDLFYVHKYFNLKFTCPKNLNLIDQSPEKSFIDVFLKDNSSNTWLINITSIGKNADGTNGYRGNFKSYAREYIYATCEFVGVEGISTCQERDSQGNLIESIIPYANPYGIGGYVIYTEYVRRNPISNAYIYEKKVGPIYAFDLTKETGGAVIGVFIKPNVSEPNANEYTFILKQIADSLNQN